MRSFLKDIYSQNPLKWFNIECCQKFAQFIANHPKMVFELVCFDRNDIRLYFKEILPAILTTSTIAEEYDQCHIKFTASTNNPYDAIIKLDGEQYKLEVVKAISENFAEKDALINDHIQTFGYAYPWWSEDIKRGFIKTPTKEVVLCEQDHNGPQAIQLGGKKWNKRYQTGIRNALEKKTKDKYRGYFLCVYINISGGIAITKDLLLPLIQEELTDQIIETFEAIYFVPVHDSGNFIKYPYEILKF